MALVVKIKKRLQNFQLDVDFETGIEVMALLGASGSGKSMTLKCIAGIESPDEGYIALDDKVLFDSSKRIDLRPQQRHLGYLFQQYALFPGMTVEQNIATGVRNKNKSEKQRIIAEKIEMMRLNGLENKRPAQLSGGQQQRVALARILAGDPKLILLDEPFSALDGYLKWQVELELTDLLKNFGCPAVFVSHSRDEVYRISDTVCVLSEGKSGEKVPVKKLFESPATKAECLISGCKNFSDVAVADANHVKSEKWGGVFSVPSVPEGTKYMAIRSHYIKPCDEPGENVVSGTVERVIDDVFTTVLLVRASAEADEPLRVEINKDVWEKIKDRERQYFYLPPEDIMLLK